MSYGNFKGVEQYNLRQQQLYSQLAHATMQQANAGNAGQRTVNIPQTSVLNEEPPTIYHVELCKVCVPIWMTRVAKLTNGSDTEE